MIKKILVKGPALSRSGYGEQTRFALRALAAYPHLFDVYLMNIPWGNTGQISRTEDRSGLDSCLLKTAQHVHQKGTFDISLQVTIPNEFEKIAPVNIGYTAGIETTKVAPEWIEKCNNIVDKVVVVSNHSKKVFENTTYQAEDEHGNQVPNWGMSVPVEVANYPVLDVEAAPIDINFTTENNFLVVSQWGPRKNLDNTIRWFVEAFKDDETAGLVLKTNIVGDSFIDREVTSNKLNALLSQYPDRKCKIYLVHGELTPSQLKWLYCHDTMKALINIGHGEGFGLPLFEAAHNGLPLITTTWSGQMDFICRPNKKGKSVPRIIKVDYDVKPVQKEAVWKGVIVEDSNWAYPKEMSFKRALQEALEKEKHYRHQAKELQKHIVQHFTEDKMYENFVEHVYGEKIQKVDVEDLPKISLITSVYNAADYIEGLMEDTTNQTIFEDKCEWVILNANPPGENKEEEIIKKYIEKYPNNIIYERLEEDPGVYATWNLAIEKSSGEFITNINCDDRRRPDGLEQQAALLHATLDVDLVYNDSYVVREPNVAWKDVDTFNSSKYNFEQFSVDAMLRGNLPHNNPMWRKSLHAEYGMFEEKYRSASDWEFWLRCSFGGSKFLKHPEILGVYYFNPTGISTNLEHDTSKREEEKEIFMKYMKLNQQKPEQTKPIPESDGLIL